MADTLKINPVTGILDLVGTSGGATGDVTGPASSTDNALVRFDGLTGKAIQNSTVTLGDTGAIVNIVTANVVPLKLQSAIGNTADTFQIFYQDGATNLLRSTAGGKIYSNLGFWHNSDIGFDSNMFSTGANLGRLDWSTGASNSAFSFNGTTGTTDFLAMLQININKASNRGLIVKGVLSQSANLTEWRDSTDAILSFVTSNGTISAPIFNRVDGSLTVSTSGTIGGIVTIQTSSVAGNSSKIVIDTGDSSAGNSGEIESSTGSVDAGSSGGQYSWTGDAPGAGGTTGPLSFDTGGGDGNTGYIGHTTGNSANGDSGRFYFQTGAAAVGNSGGFDFDIQNAALNSGDFTFSTGSGNNSGFYDFQTGDAVSTSGGFQWTVGAGATNGRYVFSADSNQTVFQLDNVNLTSVQSDAPVASAGTNAGSSPTATLITGTDVAGTISITPDVTNDAGEQVVLTFNKPFPGGSTVILTPQNDNAATAEATLGVYVVSDENEFSINTNTTLVAATAYRWNYLVIGY